MQEYPQFEAALTLIAALHPDEAIELLAGRLAALEHAVAIDVASLESGRRELRLPRLFLLEAEYELALRRTEIEFVRGLLAELRDGSFPDLQLWRSIADGAPVPDSFPSDPAQEH